MNRLLGVKKNKIKRKGVKKTLPIISNKNTRRPGKIKVKKTKKSRFV